MALLKQSTAFTRMVLMLDSADHVSGKTGLTLTITASKAGAAFASISPTVTERGNGWYSLALTTSHTDTLGELALHITGTGADPTDLVDQVSARITDDLAFPNTSGRGMDVTAGGEVGIDWANVGSPTTTLNLSGTTVKTATDVETDTVDIQGRLPAALVSGRMDASVGAMAANVLTATAIAADAITAAKIADGAIDAATFAAGAITAAVIATGAIDADALAADAVAEFWTTQLTEAYAADGVAPTGAQALFLIMQTLIERSISGTSLTIKKLDGSTSAAVITLNDASTPTSQTRSS